MNQNKMPSQSRRTLIASGRHRSSETKHYKIKEIKNCKDELDRIKR